jgi:hypothetical protein
MSADRIHDLELSRMSLTHHLDSITSSEDTTLATTNDSTIIIMSHDHTPDSLFDSFTQPDPATGSRPRSYARPSTSPTSHSPQPDRSVVGHEIAAGEETLERMMEQGGRTRRDREQRTRTRRRTRGQRDDARGRGNVDTSGDDGDDLDELFEIPRPRTRTSSSKGSKVGQTKKKADKGGKPRMTPYQDDPSLDLSLDPGSEPNTSANSDDEDGTHGPPEDGYGTDGSGQDEGDLETQIFNSIGLFPSTSSTLDLDHHVEHHNHLRAMTTSINTNVDPRLKPKPNPKQREPGWKGPLESSALKHGPQRGMFDFREPLFLYSICISCEVAMFIFVTCFSSISRCLVVMCGVDLHIVITIITLAP